MYSDIMAWRKAHLHTFFNLNIYFIYMKLCYKNYINPFDLVGHLIKCESIQYLTNLALFSANAYLDFP